MSAQLSRDDWKSRIGSLAYRNQAFIGGKFAPSLSGKTFDCINPATGQVLTKVAACEQIDVDAAVKAARAAFDKGSWANMPPANRKRIMLKLAELMMKNRDELALLETLDMGKPITYSTRVDIPALVALPETGKLTARVNAIGATFDVRDFSLEEDDELLWGIAGEPVAVP